MLIDYQMISGNLLAYVITALFVVSSATMLTLILLDVARERAARRSERQKHYPLMGQPA